MRKYLPIWLIIALATISLSFLSNFQSSSDVSLKVPEPAKDFSFLRRFYCISDLFAKEQWQNNKGRSFDKDGVHLTNAKKHPVNACHYALFCYDEFKRTGEADYKEALIAQVKYLMDPASYNIIDDNSIAYPYDIKFHDLNPPWYSALAQSEAISVLIRYYALTGDKEALPVIIKLKNFMVSPQEGNCGTKSITPEGNVWYEEYPNSKQERQVLNGFLLAAVALYEYSQLFPSDTASYRLYTDAIQTIKESFKFYDTGSWLKYNRGDSRQVANGYMKWQILEMKLLYEITGDLYFKNLMMLVSSYTFNKPYDSPGSKLKDYDFSLPMVADKADALIFTGKNTQYTIANEVSKVTSTYVATGAELSKMYDSNVNTFATLKHVDSLHSGMHNITFIFKSKLLIEKLTMSYSGLDSSAKPIVDIYFKDSINATKWTRLKPEISSEPKSVTFKFSSVKAQAFWIVFSNPEKFPIIKVSNLAFMSPSTQVDSDFKHYITPEIKGSKKGVTLNFEHKGMSDVVVFHKSAVDSKGLVTEKWNPLKTYRKIPVKIYTDSIKVHKFLIICEPKSGSATIGKVVTQPL